MSTYTDASLIYYPSGYKASKAYSLKPTDGSGDLDFTRASTATRVNESGLIESVATGVPRIDYTGGGCAKLLLEPQRTNKLLNSENFTTYDKAFGATVTFDSGFANPTGENGTYFIYDADGGSSARFRVSNSGYSLGDKISYSLFVKPTAAANLEIGGNYGGESATFNLITKTLVSQGAAVDSVKIEDYANGWTRYTVNTTFQNTVAGNAYPSFFTSAPLSNKIYIFGFQVELGSYPTSYIPTTSTAVTRVADNASKSGISSLIGQTQGTIFFELVIGASDSSSVSRNIGGISDGTGSNRIEIYRFNNTIQYDNITLGANQFSGIVFTLANFNTPLKIAISYSLNNVKTFINGVLVNTDVTALIPACSNLQVGVGRGGSAPYGGLVQSSMLFPTAKSDAELIALTTI